MKLYVGQHVVLSCECGRITHRNFDRAARPGECLRCRRSLSWDTAQPFAMAVRAQGRRR